MWIYTVLMYNFIHFPVELLISETAFVIRKQRREYFLFRLVLSLGLYFLFAYGWICLTDYVLGDSQTAVILLYLGYAVLTVIPVMCCFEMNHIELLFAIAGGYAVQHMCFSMLRIVLYFLKGSLDVQGA